MTTDYLLSTEEAEPEVRLMPKIKNKELLQQVDLEQILMLVDEGLVGKLLEVQSADGDSVEIVVE